MRPRRALIVLLVPLAVAGAVLFDRDAADTPTVLAGAPERSMPTASAQDAPTSTWYCAAGTATGDGDAEQTVIVANAGDSAVDVVVTAHSDEENTADTELEVEAGSHAEVTVSDLIDAEHAAALVEVDGGEVVVEHVLSGPTGTTAGPCASSTASTWYLPSSTTVLGVDNTISIFNPFPDMAVVDITVETEEGARTPPEFEGLVVAPGSVRAVDLSSVVTVRDQLAVVVAARSGLVVTEQVEVVTDEAELPTGLSTALGAPATEEAWYFAAARPLDEDVNERVVVFNPGDEQAEVDVQVLVDDPETNPFVDPYELSVRPGQFSVVELGEDERLADGVGFATLVESRNGEPVVAARVLDATESPAGRSVSLGSPVVATRWLAPLPGSPGDEDDVVGRSLAIANAGTRAVDVTVSVLDEGDTEVVDERSVEPATRGVVDLDDLDVPDGALVEVEASSPVAVGRVLTFDDGEGFAEVPAIPVAGTLERPTPAVIEPTTSPTVVLDGLVPEDELDDDTAPDDTAPPGTGPDDTAVGDEDDDEEDEDDEDGG